MAGSRRSLGRRRQDVEGLRVLRHRNIFGTGFLHRRRASVNPELASQQRLPASITSTALFRLSARFALAGETPERITLYNLLYRRISSSQTRLKLASGMTHERFRATEYAVTAWAGIRRHGGAGVIVHYDQGSPKIDNLPEETRRPELRQFGHCATEHDLLRHSGTDEGRQGHAAMRDCQVVILECRMRTDG
jgi:hypothetical protein